MSRPKAQLFATCLVNEFYPEVGFSVAKVLDRLGWDLEVPPLQACCGQPAFNAGYPEEARAVARAALRAFEGGEGPLLVPSGSCADMLTHQLPALFEGEPREAEQARLLASRVREFSQFLVDDLGVSDLGARCGGRVAYHPSCHLLRGLGVKDQPLQLLRGVEGAALADFPLQEECCGFGGSFSVTHSELSGAMLEEKLSNIRQADPEFLVSCDLGCLMHLEGGLRRRGRKAKVRHLAQYLAEGMP